MNLLDEHAKEKSGIPGWLPFKWEAMPHTLPTLFWTLTGCVPIGVYRSGPRKGRPKWDTSIATQVVITPAEHEIWKSAWEKKTGKCSECCGEGKNIVCVSLVDGTTYRECKRCKGTGVPA